MMGLFSFLALGLTAYSAIKRRNSARKAASRQREVNRRNAKVRDESIRRLRARTRAALSSSGLRNQGTPQLILQDDAALMSRDAAFANKQGRWKADALDDDTDDAFLSGLGDLATMGWRMRDKDDDKSDGIRHIPQQKDF